MADIIRYDPNSQNPTDAFLKALDYMTNDNTHRAWRGDGIVTEAQLGRAMGPSGQITDASISATVQKYSALTGSQIAQIPSAHDVASFIKSKNPPLHARVYGPQSKGNDEKIRNALQREFSNASLSFEAYANGEPASFYGIIEAYSDGFGIKQPQYWPDYFIRAIGGEESIPQALEIIESARAHSSNQIKLNCPDTNLEPSPIYGISSDDQKSAVNSACKLEYLSDLVTPK